MRLILPWGRVFFEVQGSTSTYTVYSDLPSHLPLFCSCPSFTFSVLSAEDHTLVGHSLQRVSRYHRLIAIPVQACASDETRRTTKAVRRSTCIWRRCSWPCHANVIQSSRKLCNLNKRLVTYMQVSRMPFFTKLMTGGHGRENQQKPDLTTVVHSVSQIARGFSKEQSRKLNVWILQISSGARHSDIHSRVKRYCLISITGSREHKVSQQCLCNHDGLQSYTTRTHCS